MPKPGGRKVFQESQKLAVVPPTVLDEDKAIEGRGEKGNCEMQMTVQSILKRVFECMVLIILLNTALSGQSAVPAAADSEELRKAAQNPVASLISVPIQQNWNGGIGDHDRIQSVLNIQPVIPFSLNQHWNVITRWITPIVFQPIPETDAQGYYGLGDLNPSFFLSPKKSKVIWGVGPTFLLPTATNTTFLGQGKLGIGPTVVVLVQPAKWTLGFLVNNIWSVVGHEDKPDVNQFLLQYFINYNMDKGYYLTFQPTNTADWNAGEKWVVPVGGGIGRITKLGSQPVNINFQVYGNVVHPTDKSPWKIVAQLAFLFPK